ncbi:MAG TPA: translocation/assembly module TamB domain-containing protein, partial [Thermodesulfobacteriota bacterium]|nr:translocation/assembly module TamB domain-containing protein [Thermodesulfobacteriota bacterium]
DGRLEGHLAAEQVPLAAVRLPDGGRLPLAGSLGFQGTLSGRWEAPRLAGRVTLGQVAYGELPLGDGGLDVTLAWPALAIQGTLLQREVALVANLTLVGDRPFVAALDLNHPNLAPLLARLAGGVALRASARGIVRAAGSLREVADIRAEARLSTLRLEFGDVYLQNAGEVALAFERGRLSVLAATFQGPTSQVVAGGHVDFRARTLDLRVNGGLDLALAPLVTDRVARSRGQVRVVVQAVGPFAAPRVVGAAQIEGGAATFRGWQPAVSVEEGHGLVVFDQDRIVTEGLAMRLAGGPAKLTGAVELAAFRPRLVNLTLVFSDASLAVPPWLPSVSRGELRLTGTPADLLLSGRVEVLRATYSRRVDVNLEALYRAVRAALEPRRATRPETARGGPRVDIRIVAPGGVRVETGLFDAELRANLQLVGRLPEPNLLGSVEVVGGTVTFRGTAFRVQTGRLDFIDPFRINPSFDLTAEGSVREFRIVMHLSGTVEKYRLEFSSPSHPTLTDLDILALLTLGMTSQEAQAAVGQIGTAGRQVSPAEALALLSGRLERVEREIERATGIELEKFQIDSAASRATGSTEPTFTVGKRFNPAVAVTYSVGLGAEHEQTVQLEYRLSATVALVAEYNTVSSVSGGVKFHFEFR